MSNRIAVINHGQVVQEGTPRDIYERPADDIIAGFVGQTNLLPAKILATATDRIAVELVHGPTLDLSLAVPLDRPRAGDEVFLSLRPEAIEISQNGLGPGGSKRIDGVVVASAYQGAFIEYEIAALGRAVRARVTNPKGKHRFQRGDPVAVTFPAADILVVPVRRRRVDR